MSNVYVVTKAVPFGPERIHKAFSTRKAAEKALRKEYPHMKLSNDGGSLISYTADASCKLLLFIHVLELEGA